MKQLPTLLLLILFSGAALGQIVHPAGAPISNVNWSLTVPPGTYADSLALDLDGDQVSDAVFLVSNSVSPPYGPSQYKFEVATRQRNVQIAADSSEDDSAHRFQDQDLIRKGLRWE